MNMRLVIIGGGNMGGAILLALLKSASVPPEDILLIELDGAKRQKISNASGCNTQAEIDEEALRDELGKEAEKKDALFAAASD